MSKAYQRTANRLQEWGFEEDITTGLYLITYQSGRFLAPDAQVYKRNEEEAFRFEDITLEFNERGVSEYGVYPATPKEAIQELLSFKLEFPQLDKSSDFYEEGDENAPFFSESYLYNLVGKEDARTILARIRVLCETLGMNSYEIARIL